METQQQNIWTLSKAFAVGDVKSLAYYEVEVFEIVEQCSGYNRCRVRVIGPTSEMVTVVDGKSVVSAPTPPLMYRGEPWSVSF